MKIVDCFSFFNELELLEFRLRLLDHYVDHFVLAESNLTHSGQPKPYYFDENKARFEPWLHKIIYLQVNQSAEGLIFTAENSYNPLSAAWKLENDQRNALSRAGSIIADDDLVLLSDLDEIPDPGLLKKINPKNGPVALALLFHYYFLDCQNVGEERWWNGTIATTGKQFKASNLQELRDKRNELPVIKNAGWHFSYLGGLQRIKQKIRSFAHTEFNKEEFLNDESILKAMEEGKDIFNRPGVNYQFVPLSFYPVYLRTVMVQYPELLHNLPLVSIVMCTYNGNKFLREQIDSILSQTYQNIELLIVDDASTDNTVQLLKEYSKKDKRIRYWVNPTNLGYNKNFEKALGLAQGNYIAPGDQDDIWEANKIEIMMSEWPAGSSFIYSLSGDFENDLGSKREAPRIYYSSIDDVHKLVFNSPVHGHACMFKKELLEICKPFPADIFYDWWISMHAASTGTIGCIPQTLTWHRVHDMNFSRALTSIKDKDERERQLLQQSVYFLETFFNRPVAREKEKRSLLYYASLLKTIDGNKFSWPMFNYVMKNRHLIFHYKKKLFVFLSHFKHALRMARKGLL